MIKLDVLCIVRDTHHIFIKLSLLSELVPKIDFISNLAQSLIPVILSMFFGFWLVFFGWLVLGVFWFGGFFLLLLLFYQ